MDVNEELKFLCKFKRKKKIFFGGGSCRGEGSGWGVRVDVIEELKLLGKFTKKNLRGSGGGVGGGGSGWWGGSGCL